MLYEGSVLSDVVLAFYVQISENGFMKAERSTVGEPPLPIMLKRIRRAHGPMIEEQVAKLVSKTGADAADACLEVMNNQPPSRLLTLPLGAGVGNAPASSGNQIAQVA